MEEALLKTEYKYYGVPKKYLDTLYVDSDWIAVAKQYQMCWSQKYFNKIKNSIDYNETAIRKIRVWKDIKDLVYIPTSSYRYSDKRGQFNYVLKENSSEEKYGYG